VIPTFARQIESGGPVTVTDAKMTRFFMSVHEAVQLVLQAAAFSTGGEVFILEMGEPVNILDLAERMVRLSGRTVGSDVAIRIVGARPGEKVEEVLHAPSEALQPTPHPGINCVRPERIPAATLAHALDEIEFVVPLHDEATSRRALFDVVEHATATSRRLLSTTTLGGANGTH
jgi:FlaA1/EpsC-like NDP-sugar epimerase